MVMYMEKMYREFRGKRKDGLKGNKIYRGGNSSSIMSQYQYSAYMED